MVQINGINLKESDLIRLVSNIKTDKAWLSSEHIEAYLFCHSADCLVLSNHVTQNIFAGRFHQLNKVNQLNNIF